MFYSLWTVLRSLNMHFFLSFLKSIFFHVVAYCYPLCSCRRNFNRLTLHCVSTRIVDIFLFCYVSLRKIHDGRPVMIVEGLLPFCPLPVIMRKEIFCHFTLSDSPNHVQTLISSTWREKRYLFYVSVWRKMFYFSNVSI